MIGLIDRNKIVVNIVVHINILGFIVLFFLNGLLILLSQLY